MLLRKSLSQVAASNSRGSVLFHYKKSEHFLRNLLRAEYSTFEKNETDISAVHYTTKLFEDQCKHLQNDESWIKRIVLEPIKHNHSKKKCRKSNYLLLIAYLGKEYHGLQMSAPMIPTIEGELFEAFSKAKLIGEFTGKKLNEVRFRSVSRTDAGVSAIGATIFVRLKVRPKADICNSINEHLPDCIRILSANNVQEGFNLRRKCLFRSYSYTTPTYAFAPITEIISKDYRITPDSLEELRTVLKLYQGNHSFRNFTMKCYRRNNIYYRRQISSITSSEPFIYNGVEFIQINIKGNSFMLNQIRRMLGFSMAVCRGFASKNQLIYALLALQIVETPKAPSTGLVMEDQFFIDGWNWTDFKKDKEDFRKKFINPFILETETKQRDMLWFSIQLARLTYNPIEYYPDTNDIKKHGLARAIKNVRLRQYMESEIFDEVKPDDIAESELQEAIDDSE